MAKSAIVVNKLILTLHGSDYVLTDIQAPIIYGDYVTAWENAFLSAASNVEYAYTVKRYQNSESDHIAYDTLQSIAQTGNLDLLPYCRALSNGQEFYIWREEVGRGIRIVVRNVNGSYTVLAYVYGTYTNMNGFPNTGTGESGNADVTPSSKAGFAFDSDSGKYVFYIQTCANESNLVKPAYYAGITYQGILFPSAIMASVLYVLLNGNAPTPPTPSSDPYADGGTSTGTTTGTGNFDDTSEAIADPSTPALSPSIGNFVNQYVVSANALSNFGAWLYSGGSIFDDLAKLFQSPMEAIINVGILPYSPTHNPDAYVDIKVGGLNSNVQANLVTDNYKIVDMGTLDFDPFYGSALDYNPYTKCSIYLPYCGTFPLNVDEIMGHTISLKYYCDSLSGDCVAVLSDEERVLEQFRGNVFIQVPITARDFSTVYANALSSAVALAAGIASVAATGGISAPAAVGIGSSMAANAMNSKTHYSRSGGFSGVAGLMSVQTPYVILTVPRQCLPEKQNSHQGYPLFVTKRLGDFSGFTKVYEIHLDGLDCTDAEAKEIYDLLKGGVII